MKDFLKLTAITYQILEFFPDKGLLRIKAQEKVLKIQEAIRLLDVCKEQLLGREDIIEGLKKEIEILLDYLKIGALEGYLSFFNYFILSKEYEDLKEELERRKEKTLKLPGLLEGAYKDQSQSLDLKEGKKEKLFAQNYNLENVHLGKKNKDTTQFNERQGKIIDYLKTHKRGAVRDFHILLPGTTKRTIRRDLEELMKKERIERKGEYNQVFYILAKEDNA